ncbi:endonuclease/exonuclease/phosphatase family protein [Phenylobacterium sp.]|uniref:endonuclease/exonuclease/phosphatase family protein n=1 Tax=Phenylobacterium sp. TaxID=1871053 RepID=UPI003BAA2C4F
MTRVAGWVNVALTLLVLTVAVAAGLSLLGGRFHHLDLLSHFAPLYAITAALGLVWSIVAGRGPIVAASLLGLLASGILIAPEFRRDAGPAASVTAPGQIKVIQFNAGRDNSDIQGVADWLIAQDADVITLTEGRRQLRRLIQKRTGWRTAGGHGQLVIYTRDQYVGMVRPRPPKPDVATFVNATYDRPGGPVEVITAHLTWPTRPDIARQMRAMAFVAAARPRDRMILTGDLNASPWSAQLRRLDASLGLTRRDRAVATWPAQVMGRPWPLPFLAIDHVYAGPGWATVKVERGPHLGSDHYPLIVTLAPVGR